MAKKTEVVKIGDHNYTITQLSPRNSTRVLVRLAKITGVPVGKALGSLGKIPLKSDGDSLLDREIDLEKLGASLGSITERLDEEEVLSSMEILFQGALRGGKVVTLEDSEFQGETLQMLDLFRHCLRVNFEDFLVAASARLGGGLQQLADTIRARQTSTGDSGESSSKG